MTISKVEAWKTSEGACFESKESAYIEEIVGLYRSLPSSEKRPRTTQGFRGLVGEVRRWLDSADATVAQMAGEPDGEIAGRMKARE